MRIGSLFSGIGGLELGLERAGLGRTVWQVEYDDVASSVLALQWPAVTRYGDVRDIDWTDVEPADVLCGGYPCQPFSHAGNREGEGDERHMWPYYLDAVRVLRPRLAVLENVSGHLSLGFGRVLGDLAEIGYDAKWTCLRASDVGAPHRRERVFVLAYPDRTGLEGSGRPRTRGGIVAPVGRASAADASRERGAVEQEVHGGEPSVVGSVAGPSGGAGAGAASSGVPELGRGAGVAWGEYAPAIRRWERILGRPAPAPTDQRGRLSFDFSEWMMGFPAGWTASVPQREPRGRIIGNAVVPQVAEVVGRWALAALNRQEVAA